MLKDQLRIRHVTGVAGDGAQPEYALYQRNRELHILHLVHVAVILLHSEESHLGGDQIIGDDIPGKCPGQPQK